MNMMIFSKFRFFLLICVIGMLFSCEKVVDLNLNKTDPKIVIEALLSNELKGHQFYISRSLNFNENTTREGLTGAQVKLQDNLGNTFNFMDHGEGVYQSPRMRGVPGRTYTLTVNFQGKIFTAISKMPEQVNIDLLTQTESTFFNETRNAIEVTFKDPPNQVNYYYFRTYVNGEPRSKLYVESDRFTNGKEVKHVLYFDEPDLIAKDQVRVQLYTIDATVFRYLYTIDAIDGSSGPPTAPANPVSNLSSGALGYFSASTVSEKFIVLR
ncbi:MAG: DUF4249 domain-containing protein [Pedobacter sp.]|nr:MAG: DUF4249 domain-containing protein [Pedobacter sp.]